MKKIEAHPEKTENSPTILSVTTYWKSQFVGVLTVLIPTIAVLFDFALFVQPQAGHIIRQNDYTPLFGTVNSNVNHYLIEKAKIHHQAFLYFKRR